MDIFDRVGSRVTAITGPTGYGLDAKRLVALVAERVSSARKVA